MLKSFHAFKKQAAIALLSAAGVFIALEGIASAEGRRVTGEVAAASGIVFIVVFVLGLYLTFKERWAFKQHLDDITAFITVLSNGKLSDRMEIQEPGELASIGRALNRLADRFENQVQSLQKLADEKAELAEQAKAAAAIEERQRLARDLHDAVSQQLFALNMLASAAKKTIDKNPEAAKRQIEEIADIALKAQGEMRALLLHLRPVHLSGDSLQEGMEKLIDELARKTNIRFETDIQPIEGLSKGVEDHLFRLLQESLSNALRHSGATVIKLELRQTSQAVVLKVHDNGKGFDVTEEKKASYGLKTMRERCEELGGQLTVTSRLGEGTFVDVRIPIGGNRL
ncbi:sensor histidine kinase [Caenibacillus caldisaponilyticus]|jgi:NarL family two-component system sensor histidine kinase LiaS|uniref:sensor histidine kinase n=1 Tax=Caenibacillus caldisaponilyticus TaxID=1674942 RepID=UPI00098861ED|nr:sensor histidine kinase [Caenibacillus caldisaponilyticus]